MTNQQENKTEGKNVHQLDVSVFSEREIKEEDVVSKIFAALADQDGISMGIAPLEQTITRKENEAYNQAIDDAIGGVNGKRNSWNLSFPSNPNKKIFQSIYDEIVSQLQQLKKEIKP